MAESQSPADSAQSVLDEFLIRESEIFRVLKERRTQVWQDPTADQWFHDRQQEADNADDTRAKGFMKMMIGIGNQMQAATKAIRLPGFSPNILDLCMAPGGFTAIALKHNPKGHVHGITLPVEKGGHRVLVKNKHSIPPDPRVEVWYTDITMLAQDFDSASVVAANPHHPDASTFVVEASPYSKEKFDLVFCDGQNLRTHIPFRQDYRRDLESTRLTVSQLLFAMSRIRPGGNMIMLFHALDRWDTAMILHLLDQFSELQLFKPRRSHAVRSSFYAVCKNVQPECQKARKARQVWKAKWLSLTFPSANLQSGDHVNALSIENDLAYTEELLRQWGSRLVALSEPVWSIQSEALHGKWLQGQ